VLKFSPAISRVSGELKTNVSNFSPSFIIRIDRLIAEEDFCTNILSFLLEKIINICVPFRMRDCIYVKNLQLPKLY
jgi:hypothetical protein